MYDNVPVIAHMLNTAMNRKLTREQIKNAQCKWTNKTIYKFALKYFTTICPIELALASNYVWAGLKQIDANRLANGHKSFYCRV
jgi:hypothetical protein